MNYIILESQTTNGTTAVLTTIKSDRNEAEQEYHSKLSFAAVSVVPLHAVTMLSENGRVIKSEAYSHETQPTVEETPRATTKSTAKK